MRYRMHIATHQRQPSRFTRICVSMLIFILLTGCSRPAPHLILWAWERPENLQFLPPGTEVAYLAATLEGATYHPRQQFLRVPPATRLTAVVRLESPTAPPAAVVDDILRAVSRPEITTVQIDFDATRSQRPFYRDILIEFRRRLPAAIPIEITALVSWCMSDDWLRGLPITRAIPMFFRMGADPHPATTRLREPFCQSSLGISTDEAYTEIPRRQRVYIFHPRPWTEAAYRSVLQESKKW
jgi:hypothetical protein